MSENATFRPSIESKGFVDTLKQNGTYTRAIDAYAFAAAYALKLALDIDQLSLKSRSDLASVGILDDHVRLALECGVLAIRKRKLLPPLTEPAEMVDSVTRYAEVGLSVLRQRWEGKTSLQIHYDIKKLISD